MATRAKKTKTVKKQETIPTHVPGTVKLVLKSRKLASGTVDPCVARNPSTQRVSLAVVKELSIESDQANQGPIEILVPSAATTMFSAHPLKPKPGDPLQLSVTVKPGKKAVFKLNGKLGRFKYDTEPDNCSGAHHDDFHLEC